MAGAVLASATLIPLSACSPDPDPLFALAMVGDRATVLIAECARAQIDYVAVWERADPASPVPQQPGAPDGRTDKWIEWHVESPRKPVPSSTLKTSAVDAPAQVTLLETPPGWVITRDELTELREGVEYHLSGGLGKIGSLDFTLARLRELPPGDVLTATGYLEQHVVPEAEFQAEARKHCD
ncbi:hypothetical protein AB0G04_13830 [Actinoplanes sp. NPDC023801]|uniref:hypothetical protein n=1 Tax=Actinoplanes sp. NPDC023801 TaxID=3154595 RepID=UPI0033CD2204